MSEKEKRRAGLTEVCEEGSPYTRGHTAEMELDEGLATEIVGISNTAISPSPTRQQGKLLSLAGRRAGTYGSANLPAQRGGGPRRHQRGPLRVRVELAIDLFSMNGHIVRSAEAQSDIVAVDRHHGHADMI